MTTDDTNLEHAEAVAREKSEAAETADRTAVEASLAHYRRKLVLAEETDGEHAAHSAVKREHAVASAREHTEAAETADRQKVECSLDEKRKKLAESEESDREHATAATNKRDHTTAAEREKSENAETADRHALEASLDHKLAKLAASEEADREHATAAATKREHSLGSAREKSESKETADRHEVEVLLDHKRQKLVAEEATGFQHAAAATMKREHAEAASREESEGAETSDRHAVERSLDEKRKKLVKSEESDREHATAATTKRLLAESVTRFKSESAETSERHSVDASNEEKLAKLVQAEASDLLKAAAAAKKREHAESSELHKSEIEESSGRHTVESAHDDKLAKLAKAEASDAKDAFAATKQRLQSETNERHNSEAAEMAERESVLSSHEDKFAKLVKTEASECKDAAAATKKRVHGEASDRHDAEASETAERHDIETSYDDKLKKLIKHEASECKEAAHATKKRVHGEASNLGKCEIDESAGRHDIAHSHEHKWDKLVSSAASEWKEAAAILKKRAHAVADDLLNTVTAESKERHAVDSSFEDATATLVKAEASEHKDAVAATKKRLHAEASERSKSENLFTSLC